MIPGDTVGGVVVTAEMAAAWGGWRDGLPLAEFSVVLAYKRVIAEGFVYAYRAGYEAHRADEIHAAKGEMP